jgi:DNA-3-methyladenine glycosylase II
VHRIETIEDIATGLAELVRLDPRLARIIEISGEIPLRRRPPGFEGLARIVVSQQVSVASAEAIWNRLAARVAPFEPATLLTTPDADLKTVGLSAPKIKTLLAVARAVIDGTIDLEAVADLAPADAHRAMTALHGIGPWTADIFLLFCAGHPDIWPGGDLALQAAVMEAFGLEARPGEKTCRAIADLWQPWRSVAARLFWTYYKVRREGRNSLPI